MKKETNEFTLIFTKRERYAKACSFLMKTDRYQLLCRGRIDDSKFYVEYRKVK